MDKRGVSLISVGEIRGRSFITSRGGGGDVRKVWCIKTLPRLPKKQLHMKIVPPLAITTFKMHPLLQPFLDQVSSSIRGHCFHKL